MSRWKVFRLLPYGVWLVAKLDLDKQDWSPVKMEPTWRQAYQYALVKARQESAQNDWNPEPVLADVDAKRRIIDAHINQTQNDDDMVWIVASDVLLKALAIPYQDHPEFRDEWRVE